MESKTTYLQTKHTSSSHDVETPGGIELQHGGHSPERHGFARFYYNPMVQIILLGLILFTWVSFLSEDRDTDTDSCTDRCPGIYNGL
jgi:hypothetical protein